MRVILAALLWAALLLVAVAFPAWAQSPLVAELRVWATRYHENPQKIDGLRAALEQAAQTNADLDTLLALSQACFIYGEVRAKTPEEKLEAYDRGRQMAKRAVELAPRSAAARFWYGTNTGRWARTLWKKGRTADAQREALAVLDEKAPSNPADWTVKDVPQAKALLEQIKGRS